MTTTFLITGTHCKACKMLIEDAVSELPGVQSIAVDFATGEATLEYNDSLDWGSLKETVESQGEYSMSELRM